MPITKNAVNIEKNMTKRTDKVRLSSNLFLCFKRINFTINQERTTATINLMSEVYAISAVTHYQKHEKIL